MPIDQSATPDPVPAASAPTAPRPRRSPLRRVATGVRNVLVVLLVLLLAARVSGLPEHFALYVPSTRTFATPAGFEDVSFKTTDGLSLHGWYLPPAGRKPEDPPAPAVLFCHGNAGRLPNHLPFVQFLTQRGIGVFMFDYRSYGRSDRGWLIRSNVSIDVESALQALKQRKDVDQARLGVYGFSLGGTFAIHLTATHPELRAVCVAGAFSSWASVASDHAPIIGGLLIRDGIDAVEFAPRLAPRPLLIVHGDEDWVVPPHHARAIETAARAGGVDVTCMIIPNGDHNGLISNYPEAPAAIGDFFVAKLAHASAEAK
jgi:dipeptidyl aminopeptidase/acylaminoacyl peptidase